MSYKYLTTEEMMAAILRLDPGAAIRFSAGNKKWYISSIIDIKRADGTLERPSPYCGHTYQAVKDTYDMLKQVEYPDVIKTYHKQDVLWNGRDFVKPRVGPAKEPYAVTS